MQRQGGSISGRKFPGALAVTNDRIDGQGRRRRGIAPLWDRSAARRRTSSTGADGLALPPADRVVSWIERAYRTIRRRFGGLTPPVRGIVNMPAVQDGWPRTATCLCSVPHRPHADCCKRVPLEQPCRDSPRGARVFRRGRLPRRAILRLAKNRHPQNAEGQLGIPGSLRAKANRLQPN